MASYRGHEAAADHDNDLIPELKEKLYNACRLMDPQTVFRQDDLFDTGIIPDKDVHLLMQVAQRLCDEKLFKILRDGSVGWMYRRKEDAAKLATLIR
jgi:hypothetical protein